MWNDALRREIASSRLEHALHVLALLADHPDVIDSGVVSDGIQTAIAFVEDGRAVLEGMAREPDK